MGSGGGKITAKKHALATSGIIFILKQYSVVKTEIVSLQLAFDQSPYEL